MLAPASSGYTYQDRRCFLSVSSPAFNMLHVLHRETGKTGSPATEVLRTREFPRASMIRSGKRAVVRWIGCRRNGSFCDLGGDVVNGNFGSSSGGGRCKISVLTGIVTSRYHSDLINPPRAVRVTCERDLIWSLSRCRPDRHCWNPTFRDSVCNN